MPRNRKFIKFSIFVAEIKRPWSYSGNGWTKMLRRSNSTKSNPLIDFMSSKDDKYSTFSMRYCLRTQCLSVSWKAIKRPFTGCRKAIRWYVWPKAMKSIERHKLPRCCCHGSKRQRRRSHLHSSPPSRIIRNVILIDGVSFEASETINWWMTPNYNSSSRWKTAIWFLVLRQEVNTHVLHAEVGSFDHLSVSFTVSTYCHMSELPVYCFAIYIDCPTIDSVVSPLIIRLFKGIGLDTEPVYVFKNLSSSNLYIWFNKTVNKISFRFECCRGTRRLIINCLPQFHKAPKSSPNTCNKAACYSVATMHPPLLAHKMTIDNVETWVAASKIARNVRVCCGSL